MPSLQRPKAVQEDKAALACQPQSQALVRLDTFQGRPARGHKRQAKRLHRRTARRRKDALHKFSRKIVDTYQTLFIGDVCSLKLAKTSMAKSVMDAGWGILKTQIHQRASRPVEASSSLMSETRRGHAAAGGPSPVLQVWTCSLKEHGYAAHAVAYTTGTSMLHKIFCSRGGAPRPFAGTSSRRQLRRRARHLACARQGLAH
jgi:hypothetical protein